MLTKCSSFPHLPPFFRCYPHGHKVVPVSPRVIKSAETSNRAIVINKYCLNWIKKFIFCDSRNSHSFLSRNRICSPVNMPRDKSEIYLPSFYREPTVPCRNIGECLVCQHQKLYKYTRVLKRRFSNRLALISTLLCVFKYDIILFPFPVMVNNHSFPSLNESFC